MTEARPPRPPSTHFVDHLDALRGTRALGPVLDLACGRGRHTLAAAGAGLTPIGLDVSRDHLADLAARAKAAGLRVACLRADLETGREIPVRSDSCGAILVFRFLFRPLSAAIASRLAPGGLLLYETFTVAQGPRPYGPSRPEFLLAPGELPGLFPGLEVVSYAEIETGGEKSDAVARLVARKPIGAATVRPIRA